MPQPDGMLVWLATQVDTDEAMLVDGGSCRCGDGPQRPDCADRVAFDVAAKRVILAVFAARSREFEAVKSRLSLIDTEARLAELGALANVVSHLAMVYTGRDGFREEWGPQ
jgi:hypothetical protein